MTELNGFCTDLIFKFVYKKQNINLCNRIMVPIFPKKEYRSYKFLV